MSSNTNPDIERERPESRKPNQDLSLQVDEAYQIINGHVCSLELSGRRKAREHYNSLPFEVQNAFRLKYPIVIKAMSFCA